MLKNLVVDRFVNSYQHFQYYYEHFPAEHFSLLYLLNTFFCGFANYTTYPIFNLWIVDGENTGDYNFYEGKYGFKFSDIKNYQIMMDSHFGKDVCTLNV